jgi:hypothetical protein
LGASATTITGATENDETPVVRDTAGGRKYRTITGCIKKLFRTTAKVVTGNAEDEAPAPKKKRGDTEGDFAHQALRFTRRSQAGRLLRKFAKATRLRLQRRYVIQVTREAWGPSDAHLQTTLNLFDQPAGGAPHDTHSSPAIRHVPGAQPNRLSLRA